MLSLGFQVAAGRGAARRGKTQLQASFLKAVQAPFQGIEGITDLLAELLLSVTGVAHDVPGVVLRKKKKTVTGIFLAPLAEG